MLIDIVLFNHKFKSFGSNYWISTALNSYIIETESNISETINIRYTSSDLYDGISISRLLLWVMKAFLFSSFLDIFSWNNLLNHNEYFHKFLNYNPSQKK